MNLVEITVPRGLFLGGEWRRDAVLRPISGSDELMLSDDGDSTSMAARVTRLLTACVFRLGNAQPPTEELVRSLCVGDREALLLHLRRLTEGGKASFVLLCPKCGDRMDLDIHIPEILLPPYEEARQEYEIEVEVAGACYAVTFRLPNGADQEAAATVAASSPEKAAELILARCVRKVVDKGSGATLEELPAAIAERLSESMAERDPQAEILFHLTCPACSESFIAPFDAADLLFGEMSARQRTLYREVHSLALHYHWSEQEILSLPRRKRQLYLELLAESMEAKRLA